MMFGEQLSLDPGMTVLPRRGLDRLVLIPVADLTRPTVAALGYARSFGQRVRAVHVTDNAVNSERLRDRWTQLVSDIPLVVIEAPYRNWEEALLGYMDSEGADSPLTVVIPEFVPKHWWEHLLHSQSALRLKAALLSRDVIVVDIPYHLQA